MPRYDTGLSNLSYTSKDFNSIYNELLDLADRISPKWKPSQSNESDPGALLLKLDAIVGDKNNYNIDKNVLELFPRSVTQYPAAREIFEQCGYIMPYYKAAEVAVALTMDKEPEDSSTEKSDSTTEEYLYTIPDFTMLTNEDNSIVYTITSASPFITSNGDTYEYNALQGTINDYIINNDPLITCNSIDVNNRLYFKEANVAENGIFIQNVNKDIEAKNYSDWLKVDNLMTQPQNTPCYKFGVSKDGARCFIEFPNDIANIIGQGLKIKYITTSGYNGNISSNTLNNFFSDVTAAKSILTTTLNSREARYNSLEVEDSQVSLTRDNVYIRNVKPSNNGRDPETIEEAYKNYERTKNTFETLVSLRDYTNFLLTSNRVGNGFVCDRSNDIQSTTKIITSDGNLNSIYTQVATDDNNQPELTAFDLRIYALKHVDPITTESRFDLSFELASQDQLNALTDDLEDIKCIQHDFEKLKRAEIINIQLRYPIHAKIIPFNRLGAVEQLEVQSNIAKALYETLNGNKVNFGEEIDYSKVYDTIMQSDYRIKSLILDDFDYQAYVIYRDSISGLEQSALLDPSSDNPLIPTFCNTIKAKATLSGITPLFETPPNFNYNFSATHSGGKLLQEAGKVTTNSQITVGIKDNKASVKLTPNESIYLTVPNMITKDTYGNYVKYFYNLKSSVGADDIKQLGSGEYIIFFWKKADGDDEPYFYHKYSEGDIISPNFTISAGSTFAITSDETKTSETRNYYTAAEYIIKNCLSGIEGKVPDEVYETLGKTYNDIISKCDINTILSGTKSISIKSENKITFNKTSKSTYKLYWILNDTITDINGNSIYVLFNKDQKEYTLKVGEYLFYSDKDGRTFSMLGSGTKLTRDLTGTNYKDQIDVKAKSYEEVMYGVNNLLNDENLWFTVTSNTPIEATEMLFYNIGAESTLNFEYKKDNLSINSFYIDNSGFYYTDEDKLKPLSLVDWDISYDYETISSVKLPSYIGFGDTLSWTGYSILNLSCSNTKEQILYKGSYNSSNDIITSLKDSVTDRIQSITKTHSLDESNDSYKFNQVENVTISSESTSIYIQSNYPIETIGGENIDITIYDILGKRYNNGFYSYDKVLKQDVPNSNSYYKDEGDFNTLVVLSKSEETISINVNLPPYSNTVPTDYLIPIITYSDFNKSSLTIKGLSPICDKGDYLNKAGLKFFTVSAENVSSITFTVIRDKSDSLEYKFRILPIVMYINAPDSTFMGTLKKLDPNYKFNYAYKVDSSVLIKDPLDPKSFLDTNHPYNKCTICRWDYKNSTATVTNKIK